MSIRIKGERSLKTPAGLSTRPTPSKVRAAVFNILQSRVYGANWLDICAGSGAMGAEALVRGANQVVGIELSAIACRIVNENWQKVAKSVQSFQVIKGDAVKVLPKLQPQFFDLVYFDPPYQSELYQPVLMVLPALLAEDALVIAEGDRLRPLPDHIGSLTCCDRRQYGQTALTFYRNPRVIPN
ncbi:16S rRNA (guanine(966)-N(2))-methyltransferase RsmD [Pseudanabaena sp. FACHB-1998]|uniref:16S rRNA (guanine(966)-N(2))-methyltransferase RsmD n=1 Tax=Pseudanabaena sp. FACHB-1998 TaxID=2692858 RepID=UPI001681A007|nr:16S rRNA (guanine(966)-N(2))-methyltransferase RsmD [Pseudanabaena sp. FACHB-1998]MBD2175981.1 16S rRNA (guanine(966)-N(2))-methyltransferase RsmD [Pseudanabaena sp. FACHB-1998]